MRRFALLWIILFAFSGCTYYAPSGKTHPVRVVTQIDVTATHEGALLEYRYTENEKMEAILHYLRQLKPDHFTPIAADTFRTDAYEIRLTLSDGSNTVYRQIYNEYLQKDQGPWRSIDQTRGGTLLHLLSNMSSDKV